MFGKNENPVCNYVALENEIESEYSNLGDFIYKLPNFIQAEEELEKRKLDSYFPAGRDDFTDKLRALRYDLEFTKIYQKFPVHVANANLFLATSFFEGWLIRLVKKFEERLESDFSIAKGTGFKRIINFLKSSSIDVESYSRIEQIYVAMKIRNFVVHTHGFLDHSRNHQEIRHIVAQGRFRASDHPRPYDPDSEFWCMKIVTSEWGDTLIISNHYNHLISAYFQQATLHIVRSIRHTIESATL